MTEKIVVFDIDGTLLINDLPAPDWDNPQAIHPITRENICGPMSEYWFGYTRSCASKNGYGTYHHSQNTYPQLSALSLFGKSPGFFVIWVGRYSR